MALNKTCSRRGQNGWGQLEDGVDELSFDASAPNSSKIFTFNCVSISFHNLASGHLLQNCPLAMHISAAILLLTHLPKLKASICRQYDSPACRVSSLISIAWENLHQIGKQQISSHRPSGIEAKRQLACMAFNAPLPMVCCWHIVGSLPAATSASSCSI